MLGRRRPFGVNGLVKTWVSATTVEFW